MARAESEESVSRMDNLNTNNIHVMLVGPAGAGKSSLIKSLIQLCKSSDGSPPCDYSYIHPAGGGMLGGHTLMRQTVDSVNTLTFANSSGWYDWSNKTAVEGLTAQIRGEKAVADVDRTDTERYSSSVIHPVVPHLDFSKVDCIGVVLNGQAGIEGIENLHGLVDACRKNTRRRPSFVITHEDTMSGEQIEQMKSALETEYGIDPYKIVFIENITTPNQEIEDVDMKSRLCEFLAVCAADGKVGADFHRMRENTFLKKVQDQHKDEKNRKKNEIVDAQNEVITMNQRVKQGQLDADTANKMVHLAEKQVDMLNNELKHADEIHLLKTECNKARQSIREISRQRELECKWHELQIGELKQELQHSTTICDSLVDTKASLQGQLKNEHEIRNHTEMALTEKDNIVLQTHNVFKQRELALENKLKTKGDHIIALEENMKKVQDTVQQQLEQMKSERERSDQRIQQHERETLKLRRKIQLRRSEEQKKMTKKEKALRKKYADMMASSPKPKAGLPDKCSNPENLDQTAVRKLEEQQPNDEFAAILKQIADDLYDGAKIDSLGIQLGIIQGDIERALMTNMKFNRITSDGTHYMLKEWREGVYRGDERIELRNALVAAKLKDLADRYIPQVEVAMEDKDQLDCESAPPRFSQEHDANKYRTTDVVPTSDGQSGNTDKQLGEQASNIKHAQEDSQITEEIVKTPMTTNVQEIVTLLDIKDDIDDEKGEADYSFHRMRESGEGDKHDRCLKMENYDKLKGDDFSHRLTSSSSEEKKKQCICC